MKHEKSPIVPLPEDEDQIIEPVDFTFGLKRRSFVQLVATGLVIAAGPMPSFAQQRGGGRRGGGFGGAQIRNVWERVHIGKDGVVTLLAGKVEVGQGSRAEYTQAAAEELRVAANQIQLVMSDTGLTPNDGNTAGSGSTPRTVPAIRAACAAAREALIDLAAQRWGVERGTVELRDGKLTHGESKRTLAFGELAQGDGLQKAFEEAAPAGGKTTEVKDWKVLGSSVPRPNARDLITGGHRYPSDIKRPDMLRGKVLRPPAYGAKLASIDLTPAKEMKNVVAVQDGDFVGVAAPTTLQAEQALAAIAKTAKWETAPHPSSKAIYDHLRERVPGGAPKNSFAEELAAAKRTLRATYLAAYIQHAPMETRAAVAEWKEGQLTVWTGTQNPFGHQGELARAFRLSEDQVRVVVPDTGGGFGGKHTGEVSVEVARLAKAAGKPVSLKWTREEEFTWAYFRPAAVIDAEATLDDKGALTSWHFININSGGSAVDSPYRTGKKLARSVNSQPPLRHGSYRALASTANNFARECFMDELAAAVSADPLEFRLAHLESGRLRDVLEEAAKRFNWSERVKQKKKNFGVGLACGTEKGSYVAACVEVEIDPEKSRIIPRHVCEVFECGAIINPANLRAQIDGAIIMGLGPALREEMIFENGRMQNAAFSEYEVPRFGDVPELDIHLLNRPDLASAGAGETPIIAVAPAIGNAVFQATGVRLRAMPMRLAETKPA
ncbi:MAG TPA: molybdopterin cofactor-binding domain-containing protein [Verrucomicrobiae bacterium]|nr:molybdopterin cofactor-binding domain-containing protein [Verrucomicrobiae bacterium]